MTICETHEKCKWCKLIIQCIIKMFFESDGLVQQYWYFTENKNVNLEQFISTLSCYFWIMSCYTFCSQRASWTCGTFSYLWRILSCSFKTVVMLTVALWQGTAECCIITTRVQLTCLVFQLETSSYSGMTSQA